MVEQVKSDREAFPDFFILGAGKCGTTSLHGWLGQHSDICMSFPKEPAFFWGEFDRGMDFYRSTYFKHCKDELLTGDASHLNIYHAHVPARIHSVNQEASFILLVRNPIDRAMSAYWHSLRRGKIAGSFADVIKANYERVKSGRQALTAKNIKARSGKESVEVPVLDAGYYAEQLERYFEFFPKDRFKIFLMEDMRKDPMGLVRETCEFLGVDTGQCASFDLSPRNQATPLKLRPRNFKQLKANFLSGNKEGSLFTRLSNMSERPVMAVETRKWLVEHYRAHNKRLAEIFGRSLEHWNK